VADSLELGSGEELVDVWGAGAFPVDVESDQVNFVPNQLLPRFLSQPHFGQVWG